MSIDLEGEMRGRMLLLAAGLLVAGCSSGEEPVDEAIDDSVEVSSSGDDQPEEEPEPAPDPEPEPTPGPSAPLTGVTLAADHDALSRQTFTVKLPNDPAARPHAGLERADVVFEQETEYGVTRFAAVFQSDIPDVVGNVRSARPVDVELVTSFDGVMVYSGARQSVRQRITDSGMSTVTEGGVGFYRDSARNAPHNLYTRLTDVVAARPGPATNALPWTFDEQVPGGGTALDGRFSVPVTASYTTGWEFDKDAGVFRRYQNGTYHAVTGPDAIGAANVVILDVVVVGRDSHNAPIYDLDSSGDALLLRDNRRFEIGWSKAGQNEPFELLDGTDVAALKPGPTWVVLSYRSELDELR